ncbi:MAG: universal stress protein [Qipengyuania vulgaris]
MRIYLVVMDETEEAIHALRFAALRAKKTGGSVHILALVPQQTFNAFGGVQATIEQEARERAEVMANSAAGNIFGEMGKMPVITVKPGSPADVITQYLDEHGSIAALVLGTSKEGGKDPLVSHFATRAAFLPCPLYLVPGSLSKERLEELA